MVARGRLTKTTHGSDELTRAQNHAERSDEHRHRVSRSQGWIAPVVLVDGRVVAVWKHTRGRGGLEVEVTPLERLARPVVAAIRTEAEELRRFLGADDVQVTVKAG